MVLESVFENEFKKGVKLEHLQNFQNQDGIEVENTTGKLYTMQKQY